ncbi:non-SMC mitotic condensation complex subunit 1 [Nitzschia inconspicua]|uniref:Non-SMC mitotic condensation complex subunit 1 n=1 Tax=Nitzschia inconspicua TaxID=303405 RepID=A0A9K3PLT8_9STRA|nr:non-SMC mitotic condensation complex subunit 1 [Nitzschia inconspicua]
MPGDTSRFPIPTSLQELEREPYNLLPYPNNFDDDDDAVRADSFLQLVTLLERGNQALLSGGIYLFQKDDDRYDPWMDGERVQAMYTLVRKSTSLAPSTRWLLIQALCQAVKTLSSILSDEMDEADCEIEETHGTAAQSGSSGRHMVVSQEFRDAYACHLYMLFSAIFIMESEAKISSGMVKSRGGGKSIDSNLGVEGEDTVQMRSACADAMLSAARSMSQNRFKLWKRGVPDESVVGLPCRIAYQMLESATGVFARKAASSDAALAMIAATIDSTESMMGTVLAALMDLMHSFEHMAALCAELCTIVSTNRLAMELIREVGRLDTNGSNDTGKASGIKFVAPFVCELALRRPQLVLANFSHLLPHLESEPYFLRSAILTALGYIVEYIGKALKPNSGENGDGIDSSGELETSPVNLENSRSALLDILQARAHDVSSYTRSAVLKAWIRLAQAGSVPVDRILRVTRMAVDRLQDKTVIVRKQSLQLLTTLLENNPFMGDLDPNPYRLKLSEMYEFVKANLPVNINEAYQTSLANAKENGDSVEALFELEQATLAAAIAEAEAMDSMDHVDEKENQFRSKVRALKFAQSALEFIDQFENASVNLNGLLLSANGSDVTEALRFFVKARHFRLPCAVTGMRQALTLMWSTDQSIKDEVLKAFVDVFIAVPGTDEREYLPSPQIAHNLLTLTEEATVSELASIEEAISLLVKDGRIPAEVFSSLWSSISSASGDARATALQVLSMAANADKGIVDSKSRLKIILDFALGDYTEEKRHWKLAHSASLALQRIERAQVDPSCAKFLVLELIIDQLCAVARGDWCIDSVEKDTLEWFAAAEQAIGALFVLSPEPEKSCAEIVRGMHSRTIASSTTGLEKCHPMRLARFFHVLGHIALKLLVYTEALSGSVRRATAKKTLKMQEEADKANRSKSRALNDKIDNLEDELGMAAELEAEDERKVAEIAEKEIVGRGLLSMFSPILARVVANEGGKFDSEVLRQTSTLALCKFMCVSSSFCEQHLPVVFTALANAPADDVTLRANTVIALGDLAFRFPNEVEPYTPRMYACLRDSSTKVRRHTLMVLTHLILNDMVKVKGQVCEIALCLRDSDQRIQDTSRLLFHELSKRSNNPVYNLLPDIVSQLSEIDILKEDFRSILSFLLGYIKKDKQNEMLMEKLCQRFPKCHSISQKADIAYCMAQLKVNERSIKSLVDNFKLYKDSLYDEDVKKHFFSIISKAKKFVKPELKQALEEFENKLNEESELGKENQLAGEKAAKAKKKAIKTRSVGRRRKITVEPILESDDEPDLGSDWGGDCIMDKENSVMGGTPIKTESNKKSLRSLRTIGQQG